MNMYVKEKREKKIIGYSLLQDSVYGLWRLVDQKVSTPR